MIQNMNKTLFTEYIPRELSEPLRQGDIFSWNFTEEDPWKKHGIIVTADCDLAYGKYGNFLSYCPILTFKDFLKIFWVTDELKKINYNRLIKVATKLSEARQNNIPKYSEPINPETLVGWLSRRGVTGLMEDIKEPIGKNRERLEKELEYLIKTEDAIVNDSLDNQLKLLAEIRLPQPPKSQSDIDKSLKVLWEKYLNKLRSLPGDLFFLNHISPMHKEGYIIYLRRVAEIHHDDIAITPAKQRLCRAVRISQLRATFKYRITQKLAAIFADIGLPNEYESMCLETMANIAVGLNMPLV